MPDGITLEVDGLKEFGKRLEKLKKDARTRVNRQVNVNAIEFQREVRKSIRRRSGRFRQYPRGGGKFHYSSTPSKPPNSDTGNLVKLIRVTRPAFGRNSYATVMSGAKYSSILEDKRGLNRPFFEPMLRKKRRIFAERMKQAIRGLL